jgi:hypothetical protein
MPYSINRFGAIAGATVGPDSSLATLWTVSQPFGPNLFDLSSVEPSSTEATYVNDRNQIVGDSNGLRPVVGLIPGVPLSRVYALTENGVVLGADIRGPLAWTPQSGISYLNRPDGVPVLLSGGAFNSLGQVLLTAPSIGRLFTPGVGAFDQPSAPGFTVRGFNSEGQFVGLQGGGPAPAPSIYTTGGGVVALSSLLPPGNGWTLTDATAVNDNGQILVLATKGSRNTTLLLTPSHMSLPPTLRQTPQTRECVSASFNLSARSVLPCRDPLAGKKDRK